MNTINNKRKKESQEKIENVFLELIQNREINEISVTDICKNAELNRTTFYSNYLDIYDLADKIAEKLEKDVFGLYNEENLGHYSQDNFLKLFKHIKDNQIFYKTYFKLGFEQGPIKQYSILQAKEYYDNNDKYIDYHIEFFRAGLNAILKKWLDNGCVERPEEISEIIKSEYTKKELW